MESYGGPSARPRENVTCTDCDAPLEDGRTIRCAACVEAAHVAVREITGPPILPSDIARIRARVEE